MRIRIGKGFWASRFGFALLGSALLFFLLGVALFTFFWIRYSRMIDEQLTGPVFARTSRVFTAPRRIAVGERLTARDLSAYLQRAGYTESYVAGALGEFRVEGSVAEVRPGADSLFAGGNALRVEFAGGAVSRIVRLDRRESLSAAELEPELLTNLFDSSREKRRLVRYEDLPKPLVEAVLSAEDKRFFDHPGFDPIRVLGAAWRNLRRTDRTEGASTISMQVARSYFFSPERTWKRKLAETMVALQLEQRFTKERIFELYANQIYLGNRGSFAIRGFGEAAQAYFAKDVRELSLAEAAFLAGIARAPNRYSAAERNLDRASQARDRVLAQMVENNFVSPEAAAAARKAPWRIVRGTLETSSAPYFVDMVKDHLLDRFSEAELISQSYRIYTTLDASLQRAAAEAVEIGLQNVDAQLAKRYQRWRQQRKQDEGEPPIAQVALVALDAKTGEIKALIGGRDYGRSQLNRALARRQPGSVFKPFIYAAAYDNVVAGLEPVLTPLSIVQDEPHTFLFDGKEYTPNNYGAEFYGAVTLREALLRSLNVATVKVAESVGYERVVEFARELGIEARLQPTPAIALGVYEMTPLEVAAAYTVFPTMGQRAEPYYLKSVVTASGSTMERAAPRTRPVLDPRVAYVVTSVLQDVVNRGTGAGVRSRGFYAPAGGKTGTSHDGWFAGFTSDLICVVWVGFDDNRELELEGARSALPIWAEFMKRAVALPGYRNPAEFESPADATIASIDPETGQLATTLCPTARDEYFVAGTEPQALCSKHPGGQPIHRSLPQAILATDYGGAKQPEPPPTEAQPAPPGQTSAQQGSPAAVPPPAGATSAAGAPTGEGPAEPAGKSGETRRSTVPHKPPAKAVQPSQPTSASQEQKGFFRRLWGVFSREKPKPAEPPKSDAPESKKPKPAAPPAKGGN